MNMSKAFNTAVAIGKMVPSIVEYVKLAESLLPSGHGPQKLDMVLTFVEQLVLDVHELPFAEIRGKVVNIVSSFVAFAHATGIFHKSPAPAA